MTAKEFEKYLEKEVETIQKLAREVFPNEEENTYLSICIDLGSNYRTGYTIDNKIDFVSFD